MSCAEDLPDTIRNRHTWYEELWSARGPVLGYRHCTACNRVETMLFDYTKDAPVWVAGDFGSRKSERVFIFAGTQSSFKESMDLIQREAGRPVLCVWMRYGTDWEHLTSYRDPQIYLAADWKEADTVDDPRFRLLVAVGHL